MSSSDFIKENHKTWEDSLKDIPAHEVDLGPNPYDAKNIPETDGTLKRLEEQVLFLVDPEGKYGMHVSHSFTTDGIRLCVHGIDMEMNGELFPLNDEE